MLDGAPGYTENLVSKDIQKITPISKSFISHYTIIDLTLVIIYYKNSVVIYLNDKPVIRPDSGSGSDPNPTPILSAIWE
jgi:hypothetical protein